MKLQARILIEPEDEKDVWPDEMEGTQAIERLNTITLADTVQLLTRMLNAGLRLNQGDGVMIDDMVCTIREVFVYLWPDEDCVRFEYTLVVPDVHHYAIFARAS